MVNFSLRRKYRLPVWLGSTHHHLAVAAPPSSMCNLPWQRLLAGPSVVV